MCKEYKIKVGSVTIVIFSVTYSHWRNTFKFIYKSIKITWQETIYYNKPYWVTDPLRRSLSRRQYRSFKRLAMRSRVRISCKTWLIDSSEGRDSICALGENEPRVVIKAGCVVFICRGGVFLGRWGVVGDVGSIEVSSENCTFFAQKTIP